METECKCRPDSNFDDAAEGSWLGNNNVLMGAFTVVGYLLYRFSQTLPALIRWPIRLFCRLTGLSALWGWVSRLVGTIRGFQTLFKWLSRIWHFMIALFRKFNWLLALIKAITGFFKRAKQRLESVFHGRRSSKERLESDETTSSSLDPYRSRPSRPWESDLRVILLGPSGAGRTSLADTLLGSSVAQNGTSVDPLLESTKLKMAVDGRELTVIDTPDLLGPSLGSRKRALEALRGIQLSGPGPHAFLLVIRAPGSSLDVNQDASQAVQATLELFGGEVRQFIVPVLTHADRLGPRCTLDQLLDEDAGGLKTAMSLCGQRPELVDNRPDCPLEAKTALRRELMGRLTEMKELRGHFVHELQRREELMREELLTDMTSALSRKLGHV